ncbi:hypothetical protein HDU76_010206 [Blyttiomyces sp. JEL0837]|nr:hypothetical protein HDU76_010206 [Blyttiomyces sp. JEL0837]
MNRLPTEILAVIVGNCTTADLTTLLFVSRILHELAKEEHRHRAPILRPGTILCGIARVHPASGLWGKIAVFAKVVESENSRNAYTFRKAKIQFLKKEEVGSRNSAGMTWTEEKPVKPYQVVKTDIGRTVGVRRKMDESGVIFDVKQSGLKIYTIPLSISKIPLVVWSGQPIETCLTSAGGN